MAGNKKKKKPSINRHTIAKREKRKDIVNLQSLIRDANTMIATVNIPLVESVSALRNLASTSGGTAGEWRVEKFNSKLDMVKRLRAGLAEEHGKVTAITSKIDGLVVPHQVGGPKVDAFQLDVAGIAAEIMDVVATTTNYLDDTTTLNKEIAEGITLTLNASRSDKDTIKEPTLTELHDFVIMTGEVKHLKGPLDTTSEVVQG